MNSRWPAANGRWQNGSTRGGDPPPLEPRRPVSLTELIDSAHLPAVDIFGNPSVMITGITTHAQRTGRNELFVAINGTRIDSHMMLSEAVEAGAAALLVDREVPPYPGVTLVRVPDTRHALGPLAQAFHGHPTRAMRVCGVTGTNGKTTVAHLIHHVLMRGGARPGLIGTLGASFAGHYVATRTTTPDALELAEMLRRMERQQIDTVVMECSSHGIHQGRINGIPLRGGALIGTSQDHLDYHGTWENYIATKKSLFFDHVATTPGSTACFNLDDPVGEDLSRTYLADWMGFTCGGSIPAAVRAEGIRQSVSGTDFALVVENASHTVHSPLVGAFNVTNMLAAASCCHVLGVPVELIARALGEAPPVPGRFELIDEGQPFTAVVDYAHTPDALERLLRTARRLCAGRLIVVFGCGGDRDRGKRAIMGKAAGDYADFAIVTNDNPRTEDPARIARQVVEGILRSALKSNRYHVVLDRRQAIEQAVHLACPGDVVIVAGKGHEDYQDVGSTRLPFDDRAVLREALAQLPGAVQPGTVVNPMTERLA